jgi:chromatin segregation and condensation protein Rec8/ScpA/Scc1 (kleisin family)
MEKLTVDSVKGFEAEVDYTTVLDNFEGPLDLLLHLIKQEEIEIKDIFVSQVTEQFLSYMKGLPYIDVDKASEYLNIAATIIDIKARSLVPPPDDGFDDYSGFDDDPQEELIRALEEYRRKSEVVSGLSGLLSTNQENLEEHVSKLKSQVQSLKIQLSKAKQDLMSYKLEEIPKSQKDVFLFEKDLDTADMRNVVNKLVEKHEGVCGVFVGDDAEGYNFIIGSKTMDCREIANKLRTELNARGGGKAEMIQGSLTAEADTIKGVLL